MSIPTLFFRTAILLAIAGIMQVLGMLMVQKIMKIRI